MVDAISKQLIPQNAKLFVWFRVFFNCRFYYPVFAVMFTDMGVSDIRFAILNVIWAVTIVALEIPSGAWADRYGRETLVRIASVLMLVEMLLLLGAAFQPILVIPLLIINRICSGAAEACASGADEALAYESIAPEARQSIWPLVLSKMSRSMAVGFFIAPIVGATLYSLAARQFLTKITSIPFDQLPPLLPLLICNSLTAIGCIIIAWRMKEAQIPSIKKDLRGQWQDIVAAASWIRHTPAALLLITLGWLLESIIRLFYTVASNFYRLVEIPEQYFGFIGATVSLGGIILTGAMERTSRNWPVGKQFALVVGMTFIGLCGASLCLPKFGIILVLPLLLSMRFLHYYLSCHLNAVADSSRRATILSFRGLSMNIAFGTLTALYALQCWFLQQQGIHEDNLLRHALPWWPVYYALAIIGFFILKRRVTSRSFHEEITSHQKSSVSPIIQPNVAARTHESVDEHR